MGKIYALACSLLLLSLSLSYSSAAEGLSPQHELLFQVLTAEDEAAKIQILEQLRDFSDPLVEQVLSQWPRGGSR